MVNLCIVCAFLGYYWETFIQWSPDAVVPDEKKMWTEANPWLATIPSCPKSVRDISIPGPETYVKLYSKPPPQSCYTPSYTAILLYSKLYSEPPPVLGGVNCNPLPWCTTQPHYPPLAPAAVQIFQILHSDQDSRRPILNLKWIRANPSGRRWEFQGKRGAQYQLKIFWEYFDRWISTKRTSLNSTIPSGLSGAGPGKNQNNLVT